MRVRLCFICLQQRERVFVGERERYVVCSDREGDEMMGKACACLGEGESQKIGPKQKVYH